MPPPPVILAVAPNGARAGKADHPRLPITTEEIVETCAACVAEGASMLHVHVRDGSGAHVLDAEAARALEAKITAVVGDAAVVQTTTEAFGRYSAREQMAFLQAARPRAASMAWREIARPELSDAERAELFAWCAREGVALQYILYDTDDVAALNAAIRRGIVPEPRPRVLYVVGRYAGSEPSDARALIGFLSAELRPVSWMACAFGPSGYDVLYSAALMGGHVRIGFENGFAFPDGGVAPDNAALVARLRDVMRQLGRTPATGAHARSVLL
ncbi:3-keto-5-aminohexanoate cleavage protein [Rhodoligotrophos defluvii]|uniref:3-keto-5-aminohexanoate cleavage protein n=1 Tax=Rhodoligotrophos defluvii TaxID=2561934 RepID=UPI0010C9ED74|nr:3-keto-5-aminohexanoate cleavage protein [Rhodoligotrophos defluvii]